MKGYYPIPQPLILTPPVPKRRPLKGRTIRVLAHISGGGGEPLSAMNAQLTSGGTPLAYATADGEGDILPEITPAAAGSLPLQVNAPWP